jgi:hypothetical protein
MTKDKVISFIQKLPPETDVAFYTKLGEISKNADGTVDGVKMKKLMEDANDPNFPSTVLNFPTHLKAWNDIY